MVFLKKVGSMWQVDRTQAEPQGEHAMWLPGAPNEACGVLRLFLGCPCFLLHATFPTTEVCFYSEVPFPGVTGSPYHHSISTSKPTSVVIGSFAAV